mgnify:CR=1 FL=1
MKTLTLLLSVACVACTQNPVAIITSSTGETIVLNTGGSLMTKAKFETASISHGTTKLSYKRTDKDETVVPVKKIAAEANVKSLQTLAPATTDIVKSILP